MELHFIEDDLEEHTWYVELVADFIEDVGLFVASVLRPAQDP
ncbi:MAG TPA: hypothetical protein VGK79_11010 [Gaiellaceae bacterium]|jgi:hypothetical protein